MKKQVAFALRSVMFVAVAGAIPALAEEMKTSPEKQLDKVLVTAPAETEPAAHGMVGGDALRSGTARTSDTASLLDGVPGVSLYGAGGISSLPAIHGLADDRLRIKVDGMDLISSCPNHMNPALSYIEPTNVGKLKVYAGITPVSAGGDSIGGTIVAESRAPEFAAAGQGRLMKGEVGAFYRSNGNARGGNASATYATEAFSATYSASTAEAGNYKAAGDFKLATATSRIGTPVSRDEVAGTAYETNNQSLSLALRGDRQLIEFKYANQRIPFEYFPNQRMDMTQNTSNRFSLAFTGQQQWGVLKARVYQEKTSHEMAFADAKMSTQMPMNTEGKTTGATLSGDVVLSERDTLRIGGEYQAYRLDDWWPPNPASTNMSPGTFWNINHGKRDRAALFGEWEKQVDAQWMTMLGVRYERVTMDTGEVQNYNTTGGAPHAARQAEATAFNALNRKKTDNNWDLTALARYTASATQDVELGFARKVRSPNLYERYTWSKWSMAAVMVNTVGDGNGYVGDVNLKPETAHTASATFDWHAHDRNWEFKATPYYTHVTDYIDAVAVGAVGANTTAFAADNFNVLQYKNQSARIYGLDLSGRMPLARNDLGDFGLKGVLGYTNGKNRDTGDDLYNIMPLNTKLTLTQKAGGWDNGVEVVGVQAKTRLSDVRSEIKTPGYSLVNLRGSYSWKQVRLDFGVENLFDKHYFLPTGGAYTGQGMTMALRSPTTMPWGVAVPGMGRSVYAGVNLKF
ncbi:MAG: TonB-dependent receptor [Sterolibacteriaceae bacterium MAG5]|nr:TonB-dependent receptor [Candidatus Nitricoxidireducens bremensis]